MKVYCFGLIIIFSCLSLSGQEPGIHAFYGFSASHIYTGSGHENEFVLNSSVQKGRKSLDVGLTYQEAGNRISGANAKYKIILGKKAAIENNSVRNGWIFKTYLHYNFLYHNSRVFTPDFVPGQKKKSGFPELPSTPGTIASMEHYAGMGLQLFIIENICIDGSIGFGAYIGSLDKYNIPSTPGIHKENHGFTLVVELGMGYKFGV